MAAEEAQCKICRYTIANTIPGSGHTTVDCPRCGNYILASPADAFELSNEIEVRRHLFSGLLRNNWEISGCAFVIFGNMLRFWEKVTKAANIQIPIDNDILGKSDAALRYFHRKSDFPGKRVVVDPDKDCSVAFSRNNEEFRFIVQFLEKRGLINIHPLLSDWTALNLQISPAGWEYLSGLSEETLDQGFIAMSFHDDFKPIWKEGIEVGIANAGYKPFRVDQKDHINRIDDEIVTEIRKSRFVVADLSSQNAGAYFEAGFAMGLGKPVVWTCKEEEIVAKRIHFDTRQYSIVSWIPGQHAEFAHRLHLRIEGAIGRGHYKPT